MRRLGHCIAVGCFGMMPQATPAAPDGELFVEANLLAIFYHELGHALIDLMSMPIFGQEEDAADVISVLLIDWLFQEQAAQDIAYDSAFGYLSDPGQGDEIAWWDVHGPDEQRYYNHVCLFYGGNPDAREDLAVALDLPDKRAETCPEEYDLAAESWGAVFDEMERGDGGGLNFVGGKTRESAPLNRVIGEEVARINEIVSLPQAVDVVIEPCDEPNAFYDAGVPSITICVEFADHLFYLFDENFE